MRTLKPDSCQSDIPHPALRWAGGLQGCLGGPGSALCFLPMPDASQHQGGTGRCWDKPSVDATKPRPSQPSGTSTTSASKGWGGGEGSQTPQRQHGCGPQEPALCPHPAPHLGGHAGDEAGQDGPAQHVPPQAGVLGVLQVADPAPHPVAILHVRALQLLEDMWGPSRNQGGKVGGCQPRGHPLLLWGQWC